MKAQKNLITLLLPLIVCSAFILCAAIGMLIYPDTFNKFFSSSQLVREIPPQLPHKSYYWDIQAYAEMAINPSCQAFYALWPFIIRNIFHPQNIEQAAHYFLLVATTLFFISTFLFFWVLKIGLQRLYLTFWLVLAYTLNPMAIFRVIGYTESLFATLSTFLIWVCLPQVKLNEKIKLCLIFAITFFMGLTRPVLIQIFFSTTAAILTMFTLEILQLKIYSWKNVLISIKKYRYELKMSMTMWMSALLGYSLYGSFCLQTRGDFFAPFHDQKNWGKAIGLHLELLLFPKSLLIDLLGLYLPVIILFISLILVYFKLIRSQNISLPKYRFWLNILILYPPLLICVYAFNFVRLKKRSFQDNLHQLLISKYAITLASNYIFWFSIYFTTAHSIIIFFTQDRLHSLGRYIFAVPFFFLALGYLYRCIPGKTKYHTLWWIIFISAIALVQQWINYGQDKWLG
ncbi:mannosyltransferase [aff. Roholtiella sp. LEGE 12411]|uniref:mannosyltransferase n=1 Tax=aff. Roholtiella sp. LEGE 12411 TaxID=1828822 RepID=UPI0018800E5F|nr:mannosyltransferase [aff. Roholtiella sp. LEGE 12411]MBE9033745.1 mannosyltransferase [aff. Roholtiella sp. LEGE 12411]